MQPIEYLTYKKTGESAVEVNDPFFNQKPVDEFVWSSLCQSIRRDIVGDAPYIVNNLRVLNKLPGRRNTLIHTDYMWVNSPSRRDISFSLHIQLTDPCESDGGVAYLPRTHRTWNKGRIREMPMGDYSGFQTILKKKGEIVVLNSGVIHGSLLNTTQHRRVSLFVEFVSLAEALVCKHPRMGLREENKRYIFT